MIKKELLYLLVINSIYIIILLITQPQIFSYKFDIALVEKYYRSQDITHEVMNRIFLSDSEIHEAAGYLYAKGEDPTQFNFQHPPFIKYLYGYSIFLTSNPYYVQIFFGMLLINSLFVLGKFVTKSYNIALLASLLLIIDPLFLDLSTNLLLDLGQSALLVFYIISLLFYPKKWIVQGIILGLLATSKFWAVPVFILGVITLYLLYKKKFYLKEFLFHLIAAGFTVCFIYMRTFVIHNGLFNIVFFELKTLKYWFHHSVSTTLGASFFLFISGNVTSWWGNRETIRTPIWTILWPITLLISTVYGIQRILKNKIDTSVLLSLVPILYLIYLGIQAPFPRYFIIIIPFLYLITATFVYKIVGKYIDLK